VGAAGHSSQRRVRPAADADAVAGVAPTRRVALTRRMEVYGAFGGPRRARRAAAGTAVRGEHGGRRRARWARGPQRSAASAAGCGERGCERGAGRALGRVLHEGRRLLG